MTTPIDPLWAARLHLETGTMLGADTVTALCEALVARHQTTAGEHDARLAEREACARLVDDWHGGLADAMRTRGRHPEINPGERQEVAIERNGRNHTQSWVGDERRSCANCGHLEGITE